MKYITTIDDKEFEIEVVDEHHIRIGDRLLQVDFEAVSGQPVFSLILDSKSYESYVYQGDEDWEVLIRGQQYQVKIEDEREKRLRAAAGGGVSEGGEFHLKAPMPGLVVAVLIEEGREVKKGQVMLILESMKMQNELKAPRDGIMGRVRVKAGESVEQKADFVERALMNGQEIEAKFHVQNLRKIELRLLELKAQLIQPRVHEVNLRFDRSDGELRNSFRVLRLRKDDIARFTFKGPSVEKEGGILSRQEIEFEVGGFDIAKQFLEAIGFQVVVFYEKFRTTYELNDTHIMLDELPYGSFIEIEGENVETIHSIADLLSLNWDAMVKAGYHALFERVAGKYGLDVSKLSFENLEGVKINTTDMDIVEAD